MLRGLRMMDQPALEAFCEELALPHGEGQDPTRNLIAWMAGTVGAAETDEQAIELGVLRWLADRLGFKDYEGLPVNELEASLRRKIAEDSHDFLFPFMEVGSAVAYIGPKKVVGPKLELLESSTAGLIPSHSARERMRKYWQARGASLLEMQDNVEASALLEQLAEPISILKHGSEATRASVISLSFAVALSDGRYEVEEEQFCRGLAAELGIGTEALSEIETEVNQAFWKHLTELGGGNHQQRSTGEALTLYLRAAQMALESSGSLANFSAVVERGFVGSIHSTMSTGSKIVQKMKTWGRTPIRLPLGFATGMLCYIRDRLKADDGETLLRLALAAIYRQHLDIAAETSQICEEEVGQYVAESEVENPADILAETVVGKDKVNPVRKITLDPIQFEAPE